MDSTINTPALLYHNCIIISILIYSPFFVTGSCQYIKMICSLKRIYVICFSLNRGERSGVCGEWEYQPLASSWSLKVWSFSCDWLHGEYENPFYLLNKSAGVQNEMKMIIIIDKKLSSLNDDYLVVSSILLRIEEEIVFCEENNINSI